MNEFDFFYIHASSTSKRAISKVTDVKNIYSKVDRRGRWPRTIYTASIKYLDATVPNSRELINQMMSELPKVDGVGYQIKYEARD